MPTGLPSCLPWLSPTRVAPASPEPEHRESPTPLAEDFDRAQQAAVQASMTADALPGLSAHALARTTGGAPRETIALGPIPLARRSSAPAAPSSRTSTVDAPVFTIDMFSGSGADRAQRIFDMLWQEVATPALRALGTPPASDEWRDQLEQLRQLWSEAPHEPGSAVTHPWHDTLRAHLHRHARMLALRGFDVKDVTNQLEVLLLEQRPGFSWRSFYIGTVRDALPFAIGSVVASLLAESTDPTRSQAWLWPPLAAMGVVLINLLGMAGFNATHSRLQNRITRTTPAPGLEGLSAILSTPYRAAFAQVLGFVFCYGVLRNGARYGIERLVSGAAPGLLARRFGDTLHAAFEVPLAPIPGLMLLPMIHQLGTTRHNTNLQILAQHNLTELIDIARHEPASGDGPANQAFFRDFSALLRSTPPRLIWFSLTVTFYYLAWMGDFAAHAHGSNNATRLDDAPYVGNETLSASDLHSPSLAEEARVAVILDILYGVIGLIFSIGHTAGQREDIRTAHERRAPQPKISTSTVTDSGWSSGNTSPTQLDSPSSPGIDEVNNNTTTDAPFTYAATQRPSTASPRICGRHGADDRQPNARPLGARRHGITTLPISLRTPTERQSWRSPPSDDPDDDVQQSTPL